MSNFKRNLLTRSYSYYEKTDHKRNPKSVGIMEILLISLKTG